MFIKRYTYVYRFFFAPSGAFFMSYLSNPLNMIVKKQRRNRMKGCTSYDVICSYMPEELRRIMRKIPQQSLNGLSEIRLRINNPVSYVYGGISKFLIDSGDLVSGYDASACIRCDRATIERIFAALCRYSVHSCQRQLSEGFFTLKNGVRVGIAGTYASDSSGKIKYVSSLNFRLSREVKNCAGELFERIFSSGLRSLLICGGVNSGKTTLLRDLCRLCGIKSKVVLIDERSELAASVGGIPTNDVGIQTDVLDGCVRSEGIVSAIRSLSPQIIFTDEISTPADADAIMQGFGSGVKFAATVHAGSFSELLARGVTRSLIDAGVFDYAVILAGESMPGRISEIRRLRTNV